MESGTITVGQSSRDSGGKYISGYVQRLPNQQSGFYLYTSGSYSVTTNDTVISVQGFGGGKDTSRRNGRWHGDIVLFMPRLTKNETSTFSRVRLIRGSNSLVIERDDADYTPQLTPGGGRSFTQGGIWARWHWHNVDRSSLIFPESGRATVEVEFYR